MRKGHLSYVLFLVLPPDWWSDPLPLDAQETEHDNQETESAEETNDLLACDFNGLEA